MSNIPLNIDIQQILLHLLNFVVLFAALYFLLYKPVVKFMNKREEYYNDIESKTSKALSDAEESKKAYEEKLSAADDEIKKMRLETLSKASEEAQHIKNEAIDEADAIVASAKFMGEQEKQAIIESANAEICSLAEEAAKKIVASSTSEAYDSFIESTDKE